MYKLILLDADRTIFDFDQAEIHSIEKAMSDFEINGDKNTIVTRYKVINMDLWKQYEMGEMDKKRIPSLRFERLFEEFGIHEDPVAFGKAYLSNLSQSGFIIDGALELCQYLFKNFKVAIVTNGIKEVQESRLEQSPLKAYIHHMIVSDEVGIPKPDPRIFEFAMEQIGDYKKSEIIMIGDSLTSDILGGINFGVDTCWYNSDETPSMEGIEPTYVIRELSELYELLK